MNKHIPMLRRLRSFLISIKWKQKDIINAREMWCECVLYVVSMKKGIKSALQSLLKYPPYFPLESEETTEK